MSIEGLTSFSVAPLRVASLLGAADGVHGSLIFGVTILYETLIYGKSVPGYPSMVVGLMVLGGVQLIMIGVLGEYIGKILSEQQGAADLLSSPIITRVKRGRSGRTTAARRTPPNNGTNGRAAHRPVRGRLRARRPASTRRSAIWWRVGASMRPR